MEIITLTFSPAYDVHVYCDRFKEGRENRVRLLSREAGGKGINISRALSNYGIKNRAVVLVGKDNLYEFEKQLAIANIDLCLIKHPGRIRENITVHTECGETRISYDSQKVPSTSLQRVKDRILFDTGCILTLTGSIPDGIPMDELKSFLTLARESGANIVIDSKSFSLKDIEEVKPWLVKPNAEEISQYLQKSISSAEDAAYAAARIATLGVENAMISLGENGAVLCCEDGIFHAMPPQANVLSTIGAGDSAIAGFISAAIKNESAEDRLRAAVAFGTAACLTEGTLPPKASEIEKTIKNIKIRKLK